MIPHLGNQPSTLQSVADCLKCRCIPQKSAMDLSLQDSPAIPDEITALSTVLEFTDASTPRSCSSITRLLKCCSCGTYYYYNHYDDDGESFMDPVSNEVAVRRYTPQTVIGFLEKICNHSENTLPHGIGRLGRAFLDGASAPATEIAPLGTADVLRAAFTELEYLKKHYDGLIRDLAGILLHRSPNWHIKMYAVESLCHHFCWQSNWNSLNLMLLEHADPLVRVAAARHVTGIGTEDAAALDLIHISQPVRLFLKTELAQQSRLASLSRVFLECAGSNPGLTYEYNYGFGSSIYRPQSIRSAALYGLVVLASHQADLAWAVPPLVELLSDNQELNYEVCWVLKTIAAVQKGHQVVCDALDGMNEHLKRKIALDPNVQSLIQECWNRLKKQKT